MIYCLCPTGEIRAVKFPSPGVTGSDRVVCDRVIFRDLPRRNSGEWVVIIGRVFAFDDDYVLNPYSFAFAEVTRDLSGNRRNGT